MKILHICLCGQFNENLSYQDNLLTKYHSLLGHDVSIIAPTLKFDDNGKIIDLKEASVQKIGFDITLYRLNYKYNLPRYLNDKIRIYKGLKNTIESLAPEFIFIHGVQFIDAYTIFKYLKRNSKILAVADNHADEFNSANGFFSKNVLHKIVWKNTAKLLSKVCKVIYGVTPNRCEFLKTTYNLDDDQVKLLPLGADDYKINERKKKFDINDFRNKYGLTKEKRIISVGGKLDSKKNIEVLLAALGALIPKSFVLLIFGTVIDPTLVDKIGKCEFAKFLGWKDQNDIIDIFLASDLTCFPGSHSVLWEQSIACGVPGIFNKINGMEHILINDNVILLDGANQRELIEALSCVLFNNDRLNYMKNHAEQIANHFFYSSIAKKALNFE